MASEGVCANGCCPAGLCRCGPGKFKDQAGEGSPEERLPTVSMPKAPDPNPFSIGPMTSGGRE